MTLFTRFRGYGILTIALALFSVSIFFSFDKMLKEQEQISRSAEENSIWASTEAEVELFRLLDALRSFTNTDSPVSHDELQQRFEILQSRVERLHQGAIGAKMREIEGAEQTVTKFLDRSQVLGQMLRYLKKGDREAAAKIGDELRPFAAPLHAITVGSLHQEDSFAEAQRQRLKDVYLQLILYFAGVFVGGTVLLLLLFRGIRRARRLLQERERTEERLRESEQRFRDYAASSSDWLWETDEKGRFTYFSKGYLEKVGLNAVEILGKTHEDIALIEPGDVAWRKQRELMAVQQPFRDFQYKMRADGNERHIKVSGVPIFDVDGAFHGYRGTGTDLTAQVEAEAEAVRARTLLSEAVESLDEGFVVFDANDRLVQCNSRFRDIFGAAADAIVPGVVFEELIRAATYRGIFPDAIRREENWIKERIEHHRNPKAPYDFRLKDGRWIQSRETILANGWRVGTRIDVTYQKRREEALRREAFIWEQMSDGVIVTDLHGHITNWNPAAERMFGYGAAEVLGQTPRLLHGPENEGLLGNILGAVEREGGWAGEIHFIGKNNNAGIADTVVVPLRDDRGDRIAVIWVNHDITLRKETEAELLAAKEQAELANQAKSQFLATMSHEIRTPMNGVLGMIGLLLDTSLDEEQRTYAETVRDSGEALVTIIDDILDFSKMEAGKLDLERADFDLRQSVEAVVDLLAPRAQSRGIELGSFIAPDVPTALKGDPGRLRQILLNLAGNAVKFTERGGISVFVSALETSKERALVKFEIVDTGIGIPDHLQSGLFAEFTQVDPSYTRRYGGTGLGLAISKKLTELMGGDIGFESKLGAGSTFWFTVDLERRAPTTVEATASPRFGAARVLVVDDNVMTRGLFERQLGALGLSPVTVADGPAALSALTGAARLRQSFAFTLIDQALGAQSGEELTKQIRRDAMISGTKLVLVAPLGARIDADAVRRHGFDAMLVKPVRQSALTSCLAQLAGIPATLASVKAEAPAGAARKVAAAPIAEEASADDMSRARLLLVEDSQVNQMVATAMLSKIVGSIDTANNGIEAIESVRTKSYDLILMDVAMPEMDGLEATRIIRTMPGSKGETPIIAMTAHAMETDRQRCLAAGMDDYVTKPIDRGKLLEAVSRWLGARMPRPVEAPAEPEMSRPLARGATVHKLDTRRPAASAPPAASAVPPAHAAEAPKAVPTPASATTRNITIQVVPARPAAAEVKTAGVSPGNGHEGASEDPMRVAERAENGLEVLDNATLDQLEADTDPSVVQELVKTFILETVDRLDRISRAATQRDLASLEREAHSLKSSSGTFGARALQERAKAIEFACRDGKSDAAIALTSNIRELAASAAHAMVQHFQPGV